MIVKDEEENLARCLQSIRQVVDEIIVVDTGSRDRTVEIARRHGCRVSHFEWCDDFAAARNAALTGEGAVDFADGCG
jgi:glycosyltransferase involved in cell wall biosynthesis